MKGHLVLAEAISGGGWLWGPGGKLNVLQLEKLPNKDMLMENSLV